jgi:urease accessory protein
LNVDWFDRGSTLVIAEWILPVSHAGNHSGAFAQSFVSGFMHPILGYDHLLVMLAIGIASHRLGGSSVLLVPGFFVASLVLGGTLGIFGLEVVRIEALILVSITLLASTLMFRKTMNPSFAYVGAIIFGLVHGNAHGIEVPSIASPVPFVLGFALANALCHVTGIGLSVATGQLKAPEKMYRAVGSFLSVATGVLAVSGG